MVIIKHYLGDFGISTLVGFEDQAGQSAEKTSLNSMLTLLREDCTRTFLRSLPT